MSASQGKPFSPLSLNTPNEFMGTSNKMKNFQHLQ